MIFQLVSLILAFVHINATPLDDYVWKADSNYGWVDMGPEHSYRGTAGNRGYTAYTLNMTSQRWLTDADFAPDSQSGSIWWHYLVVIVPDEIKWKNNASMWITGGNQGNGPPGQDSEDIIVSAALATSTGMVTGAFFQVPNEHTTFAADPILKSRTEDAIIAYTWDHFLRDPSQPEWLVRFPMVKASIRAMDALTEFMDQKHADLGTRLDYYTVAGASKRGWTTWLVGVVDPARVVAIAPIVLDAINFVAVEHHQWRSYGGWTYALQDYLDMDIMSRLDTPNMALLQQMEDPYFYKERLTMPKMIVNAVLDEFQQPDDTHYWWADMPQPKHFLIAPNAEHSLATGILEVVPAIGAWIQNLVYKERIPTFDWTISAATGEIVATLDADSVVHSATLWYSYSCGVNAWDNNTFRRDWRVAHMDAPCTCGIGAEGYCANLKAVWSKKTLESTTEKGKRVYRAQVDAPGDGRYAGFFIDFKFVNKHAYPVDYSEGYKNMKLDEERHKLDFTRKFPQFGGFPHDFGRFFEFTTEVSIWPNTFPYADCVGSGCSNRTV